MSPLFQYLLKLSISLSVIYIFYHVVLRKLTFYSWNRWYLMGYSILSFFIPFISVNFFFRQNELNHTSFIRYIPAIENFTVGEQQPSPEISHLSAADIFTVLLVTGAAFMVARFIFQYLSLRIMRARAILIYDNGMKLYHVNKEIIPFSFGNAIYLNRGLHSDEELRKIIIHEFVHLKQKHSIDILLAEILCIINWYNPFAWLIRKAVRQNLEFIADRHVIDSGADRKQYQYLLLKVFGTSQFSIANQFNFSSLKKRIVMMNKMKSARMHLTKFLFVLPVMTIVLVAFRKQNDIEKLKYHDDAALTSTARENSLLRNIISNQDTIKIPNRDVYLHRSDRMDDTHKTFFKRNPTIQLLGWRKDGSLEIYFMHNGVEKYDLRTEMKQVETKYGKLPWPEPGSVEAIPSTVSIGISPEEGKAPPIPILAGVNVIASTPMLEATKTSLPSPVTLSEARVLTTNSVGLATTSIVNSVPVKALTLSTAPMASLSEVSEVNPNPVILSTINNNVPVAATLSQGIIRLTGKEEMVLEIYKSTSREKLNKLIETAKAKGVTLLFDKIEYNEKNQLVTISGSLEKKEEKSIFSANGFEKVILALVKRGNIYYFNIIIRDKKEVI
jgi:beta-lactamase regulating signal transducer with metallopeptidase domain